MAFNVKTVDRQTNKDTEQPFVAAVITTTPEPGDIESPRRWLLTFTPTFHPDNERVLTGVAETDGRPQMQLLDLDALEQGVVVSPRARSLAADWLPAIFDAYLVKEMTMLETYIAGYATRNSEEPLSENRQRRRQLITDAEKELGALEKLRAQSLG